MSNIERALTDGERNLAFTIFGTSLKYSDVKVYNRKYWTYHEEGAIMTPNGNLYAPETTDPKKINTYYPDYSSGTLNVRAWFIHEMVHVWQHENGMNLVFKGIIAFIAHLGNYKATYQYELNNPSSDLATYGFEQQAAIVEDYFRIRNNATPVELQPNDVTREVTEASALASIYAQGVLKNFIRDPAYLRANSGLTLNSPGVANCYALLSSNPTIYRSKNTQLGFLKTGDQVIIVDMGADRSFNKTAKRWQWCEVAVKSGALNGKKGWVMMTLITRIGT